MAKNIRRMLAMAMVLCMFLSALPMQALAAEGESFEHDGLTVTITPSEGGGGSGSGSGGGSEGGSGGSSEGGSGGSSEGGSGGSSEGGSGGGSEGGSAGSSESGGSTSKVQVSGTSNSTGANVNMNGTKEVTTETTKDSSGNTTTNTETTVKLEGKVKEDNIEKDATWQETTQESSTTDAEGNEINSSTVVDGESTKKWDVPEDDGTTEPDVTVDLIPGETTEAVGGVTSETTGDINSAEGQTTVTTTDRTVTAETTEIRKVEVTDEGLVEDKKTVLTGPAPVFDENDKNAEGENDKKDIFENKSNSYLNNVYQDPENWTDIPDGGDFRYVGFGEEGKFWSAHVYVTYKKDQNGDTIYENGVPVIEKITNKQGEPFEVNGEKVEELPEDATLASGTYDSYASSRPKIFMLMDAQGNKVYTYCCDLGVTTKSGEWYTVQNLEDSDYYASEESEEHIRSILMNGYWGTSDVPVEGKHELGSLEKLKKSVKSAIKNGDVENPTVQVPKVDKNGNPVLDDDGKLEMVDMTMYDLIDGLTEGEALLATQTALWCFSNGHTGALNGQDGRVMIDPNDYINNEKPMVDDKNGEALERHEDARVDFLVNWLINLKTEEKSTIVINEKNAIKDMSLTVHDKVEDHESNQDNNQDNDVYNADLNFKLAFIPGENDDLLVQITYTTLEGNKVTEVRRLAGKNTEGENYSGIQPEEDGSYVLKGLQLSENQPFNFDLRLEGTQYLENGVYVYESVNGRDASQTFVGIANGTRNVDVSVGVTISFDVDEDNHVVAERKWHHEEDPSYDPPTPPTPRFTPPGDPPEPNLFRLNHQDPEVEIIPEEPVPLATPAITGDDSGMWVAVILVSVLCMVAINIFDKKRQHETF